MRKIATPVTLLTARQRRVLNFIGAFMASTGSAPTLEEIRDHLGVAAVSTVHEHVTRLIEKGCLKRDWNRARSLKVTSPACGTAAMWCAPLVGTVSPEARVEIPGEGGEAGPPDDLTGNGRMYALRVRGNAMRDEGIRSGDTIVVERTHRSAAGRLVVVVVANGTVVARTAGRAGRRIESLTEPAAGGPVVWRVGDVRVTGTVVGLFRAYR